MNSFTDNICPWCFILVLIWLLAPVDVDWDADTWWQSHHDPLTHDLRSVLLRSIEPWHIPGGQQTPTWSSWNSTDFTQWPLEAIQDPVFAQGFYRNACSQCCIIASSDTICSCTSFKSVSNTFGLLSRYIKVIFSRVFLPRLFQLMLTRVVMNQRSHCPISSNKTFKFGQLFCFIAMTS